MAFNPNNYKPAAVKHLPVILLLDVSGSMMGEKINNLYDATNEMIKVFSEAASKEKIIDIAIITFGESVELHTPYTSVVDFKSRGLNPFLANGMTPLGTALRMAKDMIEDKETTPSNIYRPAVVLVSDGAPNDEWKGPLDNFKNNGRSSKCQRFAVAIGNDADDRMLKLFAEDDEHFFIAENASDIVDKFKQISMSVSVKAPSTVNNNISTGGHSFDNNSANKDDEDDEF
ncbi:VWA domain-containing protein [Fusobacterium animalis]|uniref:vWA domain-containing protein n=1 Tax=Fusobacterium animalis TaxID=76859 RepID=UPI0030CC14EC